MSSWKYQRMSPICIIMACIVPWPPVFLLHLCSPTSDVSYTDLRGPTSCTRSVERATPGRVVIFCNGYLIRTLQCLVCVRQTIRSRLDYVSYRIPDTVHRLRSFYPFDLRVESVVACSCELGETIICLLPTCSIIYIYDLAEYLHVTS